MIKINFENILDFYSEELMPLLKEFYMGEMLSIIISNMLDNFGEITTKVKNI